MSLLRHLVGTLLHPELTFWELARARSVRAAAIMVVACGLCWAILSVTLHAGGHAPTVTLVPIARTDYYLWQSLFVVPLLVCLWLVLSLVGHGLSRVLGGRGELRPLLAVLGFTYAVPLLVLFVVPDALIYALFGFETLKRAMRLYAPLTPLATLALTTLGIREVHGLGLGRSVVAALSGLLLQAVLGGLLLR